MTSRARANVYFVLLSFIVPTVLGQGSAAADGIPKPPSITSATPGQVDAGSPAFTLIVTGTAFAQGSLVTWAGNPLSTTFDGEGQLSALVPAAMASISGKYDLIATNPEGAASNSFSMHVQPVLNSMDPEAAAAGEPGVALAVDGAGFTPTAILVLNASGRQWNLSTAYAGPERLTGVIPAAALAAADTATIYVSDVGSGSFSRALPFTIAGNVPSIVALSPGSAIVGGPGFTLTVSGRGFLPGATVEWNGTPLATGFAGSGQLTAVVPAGLIAGAGNAAIVVDNPGAPPSGGFSFPVTPPLPLITGCTAPTGAGSAGFTVTAYGQGFLPDATLRWNGSPLATTFADATQLTASVPASLISAADGATVAAISGGLLANCASVSIAPPPALASAGPNHVDAGGPAFSATVLGGGFVQGSVVNWAGLPLATTFQSPGQIGALVPASLTAISGRYDLTVANPAGPASNALVIYVEPVLTAISPDSAPVSNAPATIAATGIGFTPTDVLAINRSGSQLNLATTYGGPTSLTAVLPATVLASAVQASMVVSDPASGGTVYSRAAAFMIGSPPVIGSLSPSVAKAGGPNFTLTVGGSGFASGAIVQWNGNPLVTAFAGGTQLTAVVPAGLIVKPMSAPVAVLNPGGAASNALVCTIDPPVPSIASPSPASATAGGPDFVLILYGAGYLPGAVAQWNGTPLATTFAGPAQLTVSVPASLAAVPGSADLTVVNSGGTPSAAFAYPIVAPVPRITGYSPTSATAGGPALTANVFGAGFLAGALVRWNGTPLATTYLDPTRLIASVPASLIAAPGQASLTVADPGGAASSAATFTINPPGPAISALSPSSVAAGGPDFTLTASGAGFAPGAVLQWNGSPLTTSSAGATQVTAVVPAGLIASAGMAGIAVAAAGGITNTLLFTVTPPVPLAATDGILNAASSLPSIAPGSLVSIYGTNLAPVTDVATAAPAPVSMHGTSVAIDGKLAPLLLVSPTQINAQVPFETQPGTATLRVQVEGVKSAPANFQVIPAAPGVFTVSPGNHAVAQNYPEGSLNAPGNPAPPGQYVVVFLTGQGLVDNPVPTGAAAPVSPLSKLLAKVQARVGGQPAGISFAGLAPGFMGVMQMNVLMPDAPPGEQTFEVSVDGVAANLTVLSVGAPAAP